jgi:anti-sigma factor RsiW
MKTSDHDLTLRALDRLPAEETRELEAMLADDPRLAAELRATEDAMAAIWHAASPLVAAPAASFEEIQARLHPVRNRHLKAKVIGSTGWAAALALAAVLVGRQEKISPSPVVSQTTPVVLGQEVANPATPKTLVAPPIRRPGDAPQRKLRETVLALRQELRAARYGSVGPRIRVLRSPGTRGSAATSDPARALRDFLTAALTEDLARRTELPTTLTVETGWTPAAFAVLPVGSVVRHRSFPVEDFADYGLLRAANGDFYDPVTQLVWTQAEDGGGYLGEVAPVDQDLTAFEPAPAEPEPRNPRELSQKKPAETQAVKNEPNPKPAPSGYFVQGAEDEKSTLIIANLPTSDPGSQLTASVDGGATTFPLTDGAIVPGPDGIGFASFDVPASMLGNTSFGLGSRELSTSTSLGVRDVSITLVNVAGESTLILTTEPMVGGE